MQLKTYALRLTTVSRVMQHEINNTADVMKRAINNDIS